MTFEVESGGRRFTVGVQRAGKAWQVTINGRTVLADVTEIGGRWSLLIAESGPPEGGPPQGGHDDRTVVSGLSRALSYEISIEPRNRDGRNVLVNGAAVAVSIRDPRKARRGHPGADSGSGPQHLVAPMPGRIVRVLVEPGQSVAPRQGLVVVEAMKMENELRATRAGTVREVRVSEGSLVEANAILVTLE